jgi:glyoxalase family protein
MSHRVLGLHHLTATASEPQRNHDFYANVLGLRFVKKTVQFDHPGTYHFCFGNEVGAAGTLLTFYPWGHVHTSRSDAGQATMIGYSVPAGSFPFWMSRFEEHRVPYETPGERFTDPDGLPLELLIANAPDERPPWTTASIGPATAIRGIHLVELTVERATETGQFLTDVLGYRLLKQHGPQARFATDAVPYAALVDVVTRPVGSPARAKVGVVHHVAFRVKDLATLHHFQELLRQRGLRTAPLEPVLHLGLNLGYGSYAKLPQRCFRR